MKNFGTGNQDDQIPVKIGQTVSFPFCQSKSSALSSRPAVLQWKQKFSDYPNVKSAVEAYDPKDLECSICFNDKEEDDLAILSGCIHTFCFECYQTWYNHRSENDANCNR